MKILYEIGINEAYGISLWDLLPTGPHATNFSEKEPNKYFHQDKSIANFGCKTSAIMSFVCVCVCVCVWGGGGGGGGGGGLDPIVQ